MKIKKLSKVFTLLLFSATGFGQPFQTTVYTPDEDYNHFSIEQTSRGYVSVGTRFLPGNNDIKIICFDQDGNPLWERFIDETKDDRALDVVVDDNDDIILSGYISPYGPGNSDLYLAKFDINGNLITDCLLEADNGGFNKLSSAGTNIIFSQVKQSYIVGGFIAKENSKPLEQNASFIAEFDLNLDLIQSRRLFRNYSHQSINDIAEVDNGFFVTGGLSYTPDQQSVMAVKLDYGLQIVSDLSFRDYYSEDHCGASLSYFPKGDAIAILSNNSNYKLPQITVFTDISSASPTLLTNYLLRLDGIGENPAGYKLEKSLNHQEALVASGYFKDAENIHGTNQNSLAWIVEFEVKSGQRIDGLVWHTPEADNFSQHGGDLFSVSNSMPYIYNQEMITQRLDQQGYVLIAPRTVDRYFGIDLFTTFYLEPSDCFRELNFESKEINLIMTATDKTTANWLMYKNILKAYPSKSKYDQFCLSVNRSKTKKENENKIDQKSTITEMIIYPNPSNGQFTIETPSEMTFGSIQLFDSQGKEVLKIQINSPKEIIDASHLTKGVYWIKSTKADGQTENSKIVLY